MLRFNSVTFLYFPFPMVIFSSISDDFLQSSELTLDNLLKVDASLKRDLQLLENPEITIQVNDEELENFVLVREFKARKQSLKAPLYSYLQDFLILLKLGRLLLKVYRMQC